MFASSPSRVDLPAGRGDWLVGGGGSAYNVAFTLYLTWEDIGYGAMCVVSTARCLPR
jgi:hypothetical protein